MSYTVTIYNQAAMCGITGKGRSRKAAFERALANAGEPFLREGGDKLTTLRTLFANLLAQSYYRTAKFASASHPIGCSVEWQKQEPDTCQHPGFEGKAKCWTCLDTGEGNCFYKSQANRSKGK